MSAIALPFRVYILCLQAWHAANPMWHPQNQIKNIHLPGEVCESKIYSSEETSNPSWSTYIVLFQSQRRKSQKDIACKTVAKLLELWQQAAVPIACCYAMVEQLLRVHKKWHSLKKTHKHCTLETTVYWKKFSLWPWCYVSQCPSECREKYSCTRGQSLTRWSEELM